MVKETGRKQPGLTASGEPKPHSEDSGEGAEQPPVTACQGIQHGRFTQAGRLGCRSSLMASLEEKGRT